MRTRRFGSFEVEGNTCDEGYTEPMDWRDYDDDIQQSTRTRLRDPDTKTKRRKAKSSDGFTFNKRIR